MGNQDKKKVQKYMAIYMSTGMCFGVSGGLIFGMILYPDNRTLDVLWDTNWDVYWHGNRFCKG